MKRSPISEPLPVFDEGETAKDRHVFDPGVNYGKNIHHTEFSVGQRVHIDGDESITATVLGIVIRPGTHIYQVGWVQSGRMEEPYVEGFRLSAAE